MLDVIKSMKEVSEDEIFGRILGLYNKESFKEEREFSMYPIIKVLSLLLSYMKNLEL